MDGMDVGLARSIQLDEFRFEKWRGDAPIRDLCRCDHQVDAEVTAAFERVAREAGKIEPKAKADTSTGKRKVDHLSMLESVRTDVFVEARNFVRQLIQSRGHV